ncbi:coiled-coil domain-containing protein 68 [Ascaphus truei]|uniref:coiled-coil domain-containing protein 68 n=1 Tax=Ascaphus truei TaxID=8439 RepID=UPI003F5AB67E
MTSLQVAERGVWRRDNQKQTEDDVIYMYGSTSAHITEETEYVRKIRSTLEKIQSQLFKEEINGKTLNSKQHEKNSAAVHQNGCGIESDTSFGSRYNRIIEKLKDKDLQLVDIHTANEDLQIKLEATREAGADSIRNATRRLYENYSKQSDQHKKSHEDEKQKMQAVAVQHRETFNKSVEKLNEVAEKIQEKHGRIIELENLMQRMEDEKSKLLDKKRSLENEILQRKSNPANTDGCVAIQREVSTLQEQINHLQQIMMSQHQNLRNLIQECEELKARLKEQDETIGDLQQRVNCLESQNKDLKYKVENYPIHKKLKVSKGVSVNESAFEVMSPYAMLLNLRNQKS